MEGPWGSRRRRRWEEGRHGRGGSIAAVITVVEG